MSRSNTITLTLFCLLLAVPPLQMILRVFPEETLAGVSADATLPAFSWRDFSAGRFQSGFEAWLGQHMGFRSLAIKTDCQINLSWFRESGIKNADVPIVGRENVLYTRIYVDAFNRCRTLQGFDPEPLARRLRALQDGLRSRGKAFVFLISPSKAEIYPEYIPARFLERPSSVLTNRYAALSDALRRHGVNTVDGHALFAERKAQTSWLLFPPGGIHWLPYSAAFAVERVTQELERQFGRPMVHLTRDNVMAAEADMGGESTDVAALLNTWVPPRWKTAIPDACFSAKSEPGVFRPDVVMVGDSFACGFITLMQRYNVHSSLDLYYYYSRLQRYPGNATVTIDRNGIDWERDIFGKDAVIVEVNEVQLDSDAWGFVEDALRHLAGTPTGRRQTREGG